MYYLTKTIEYRKKDLFYKIYIKILKKYFTF